MLPDDTQLTRHACDRLAKNVSYLRFKLGMSMRDLQARSNVSASTISRIERGYGGSVKTAAKLAAGFGVSLSALLEPVFEAEWHWHHERRMS